MGTNAKRRITDIVRKDLAQKMVFVSGPRQCGKTTFARSLFTESLVQYLNWDIDTDRRLIRQAALDASKPVWMLDEIHKNPRWRNWLKGVYDQFGHPTAKSRHQILVTGSARLDLYSRGGDSLQGRYWHHRMHPLTFSEVMGLPLVKPDDIVRLGTSVPESSRKQLEDLMMLGGFPEPFFSGSAETAGRWRLLYGTRLVREDVRDLEQVQDLERLANLYERLADCVGAPLSINSLREDLEIAHQTAQKWLLILEKLYAVFRVLPFGPPKIKAVKKEAKLYCWDWSRVQEEPRSGARFENLIAVHLLRLVDWLRDAEGLDTELRYFRSRDGHEVDFIVMLKKKPWMVVEAKLDDRSLDSNLKYLLERVKIPHAFQVSLNGTRDFEVPVGGTRVRIVPAIRFLASLP